MTERSRVYYGWRIVGVTVMTQAMQAGILIYAFGTLAVSLEAEFGTSRRTVMVTMMILSIATNLLSPLLGVRVDKGSIRHLVTAAPVVLGVGLIATAASQSIYHVWILFGLVVPIANLLLGQLTSAALMTRWFARLRGRALGISSIGTSIGGFVFPYLLALLIQTYDWRVALTILGTGVALVGAPVAWFVIVNRPEDLDLLPDGDAAAASNESTHAGHVELSLPGILATPAFWLQSVAIGLLLFTYLGFLSNLVPHAAGLGHSLANASALMSVIAVLSIVGKLAFGAIADRMNLRHTMWIAAGLMIIGSFTLSAAVSYAGIALGSAAFGLAAGGLLPVWGAMVAKSFGPLSFGRALGAMNLAMAPITMLSAPFAGWIFDREGSYGPLFLAYIGIVLAAAITLVPLRFPQTEAER